MRNVPRRCQLMFLNFFFICWQDKPEAAQNTTSDDKDKKDKIVDPFEYVRNMGTGASMEPIRSKTASNLVSSHSDPLILWKNSQIQALATLAKKKSDIPQPGKKNQLKKSKANHLTFGRSCKGCVFFRCNVADHSYISNCLFFCFFFSCTTLAQRAATRLFNSSHSFAPSRLCSYVDQLYTT